MKNNSPNLSAPPTSMPTRNIHPATIPSSGMHQSPMPPQEITPPMLNMSKNIQDPTQKSAFKKPQVKEAKAKQSPIHPPDEEMIEFESDVFISHWMSGFYEPHPTNQVKTSLIYNDFTNVCKELQRSEVVSKEVFVSMIR